MEFTDLVNRVISAESGGNPTAVSPKGAVGLMQLMPATAQETANELGMTDYVPEMLKDPVINRRLGEAYLRKQYDRYQDPALAAAAYNAGPGAVDEWIARFGDPRKGEVPMENFLQAIPYRETRNYVATILNGRPYKSTADQTADDEEDIRREVEVQPQEVPTVWDGVGAAVRNEWGFLWAFGADRGPDDPNWNPSKDWLKTALVDVPVEDFDWFAQARSEDDFNRLRATYDQDRANRQTLEGLGWVGTGLQVAAAVIDPVAIGIGLATDFVAAPWLAGLKGQRILRALTTGVAAAAGNAATEAIPAAYKPSWETTDLLYAVGGGLAVGSVFGMFSRNAPNGRQLDPEDAEQLEEAGRGMMKAAEDPQSVGAAAASYREMLRTDTLDWSYVPSADAPKTDFARMRWDAMAELKGSDNVVTRALGGQLAEDAVGNLDPTIPNRIGATEVQERLLRVAEVEYQRPYEVNYKKWIEDQGGEPWFSNKRAEFNELITRYIRETDANGIGFDGSDVFHPAVKAMGQEQRKLLSRMLDLANNPGRLDGTVRRPVAGFGAIEPYPQYLPRVFDHRRIDELRTEFGDKSLRTMLAGAIKSAQPDMTDEMVDRFAKAYWKTVRTLRYGMDGIRLQNAFSGRDTDYLRQVLAEETDMSAENIEGLAHSLKRAPGSDAGFHTRAKHRLDLDETFSVVVNDAQGIPKELKFTDLLRNDASDLYRSYARQITGAVAAARIRVPNPLKEGDWLIDGLTSQADLETAIKAMKAVGADINQDLPSLTRDEENLRFLYNRVVGIPHQMDKSHLGQLLRRINDFNFIRLMGQVGFAQVAEIGNLVTRLGLKAAIDNMPTFKSFIRDARTGQLEDGLLRELEDIFGIGADWLRGYGGDRMEDFADERVFGADSRHVAKIDNLLQQGKRKVTLLSGMAPINTVLHRWTLKAMTGKLARIAVKSPTESDRVLLRSLGMSDEMQNRVLSQLKTHITATDGVLTKARVNLVNLDKWDDLEAREALIGGMSRLARRIIQENDPGMMARWMSSPISKMFLQFRTFMLGAWTKQLLHGIHMGKQNRQQAFTFTAAVASTTLAAAFAYVVQTYVASVGRDKEWLDKRLDTSSIALAAFQRGSYSTLIPGSIDAVSIRLGMNPLFDYRTTGQPSDVLVSPALDLLLNKSAALGPLLGNDVVTQGDWRSLASILPFQNILPAAWLFNSLISNAPKKRKE